MTLDAVHEDLIASLDAAFAAEDLVAADDAAREYRALCEARAKRACRSQGRTAGPTDVTRC